jgi:hypothetical protein
LLCVLQVGGVLGKQAARKAVVQAFDDALDSIAFNLKMYVSLHYSLRYIQFHSSDEALIKVNYLLTSLAKSMK